jgi:hypothetical protein
MPTSVVDHHNIRPDRIVNLDVDSDGYVSFGITVDGKPNGTVDWVAILEAIAEVIQVILPLINPPAPNP